MVRFNTERYDTLKFNFSAGTIDTFYAVTSSGSTYNFSATSGAKVIKFNARDRNSKSIQMAFFVQNGGVNDLPVGSNSIRDLSYQRRSNIVLNLSLGDPDGGSFMRGGIGGSKERRKNLKDMLDGANEWMAKNGFPPSKTSPGDIKLAQSEYPDDDWNAEDEMLLQWLQQGGLPGADTEKDIERLLQRKSRYGGGFSSKNTRPTSCSLRTRWRGYLREEET